ncbi:MAG: hypothetical protein FWH02_07075 [Oscillospiraceae bacterium]|nr:hypothetical protein [Oscillospiraceae bacterium]
MKKKVIVILIIFLLCAQPLTAFASFGGMFGNEQDSRFTPTHPSPNATAPQFTPPANTGRSAPVPDSFYNDSQPTQGQGQASVITSEMGGGAVSAAIADTGNLIGGVMPFTPPATVLAVTGLFGAVPLLSVTPISLVLDRDDPRSAENSPQPGVTAGADGTASAGSAGSAGALGPAGSLQPGEDSSGGLTEAYRLMLGMYEQTFEPGRSFITSVPNGGITQDAVYLEFPANMKVTAEFNGRAINPSARVRVTETGSYAFRVTSPNFAAAGESVGIFTFRILPPNTAGREDAGSGTVSRPLVEEFFTVSSNNGATLIEYVFSNHKRFYANAANGETLNRPAYFILPPNVSCELRRNGAVIAFDNNKNYTDPGSYVMTVRAPAVITTGRRAIILHTVIRFNIAEGADEPLSLGAQLADMLPWGQDGDADGDTGVPESFTDNLAQISEGEGYRQYFSNGMSFWGSVENGGASDIPVSFDIPGDIFYDLTHDGNAEHYISGGEISEPGSYRLDLYILPQSIDMPIFRASFDFTVSDLAESPQTQETEDAPEADVPVTPSGGNIPEQSFSGSSFRHMTPADIYFTSNIPNGMAGRVAAQFSIPETAARVMTLDG